MTDDGWQMTDDGWRMTDGGWRMADDNLKYLRFYFRLGVHDRFDFTAVCLVLCIQRGLDPASRARGSWPTYQNTRV
jgi:hypothetical protein